MPAGIFDPKSWEVINADTERLEVPGGYLYRVKVKGGDPWIGFVSDVPGAIRFATKWLGTGDASTHFGAIEAHASMLKESMDRIADGLDALTRTARHLRGEG